MIQGLIEPAWIPIDGGCHDRLQLRDRPLAVRLSERYETHARRDKIGGKGMQIAVSATRSSGRCHVHGRGQTLRRRPEWGATRSRRSLPEPFQRRRMGQAAEVVSRKARPWAVVSKRSSQLREG